MSDEGTEDITVDLSYFAGSPTIKVNGQDLEDYQGNGVMACRRYEENNGKGWPSKDLLRDRVKWAMWHVARRKRVICEEQISYHSCSKIVESQPATLELLPKIPWEATPVRVRVPVPAELLADHSSGSKRARAVCPSTVIHACVATNTSPAPG